MDRLKQCMDVLHILALQSADPSCYALAEREISGYLQSPGASLERLNEAIDRKAETCTEFWKAMQEFVSRPGVDQLDG
jgi:hypothetical protein